MSINYIDRSHDEEIIDLVRSVMDNGTGKAETTNEHILIKLMQLRGTPMTSLKFDQVRVDKQFKMWKTDSVIPDSFVWTDIKKGTPANSTPVLCKVQLHGDNPAVSYFECRYIDGKWDEYSNDPAVAQNGSAEWTVLSWATLPDEALVASAKSNTVIITDRAVVLLKATVALLDKCEDSPYVKNVLEETAFYDGVECDGACLRNDIKEILGEDTDDFSDDH